MAATGPEQRQAPLPSELIELLDRMDVHTSFTYYETTDHDQDDTSRSLSTKESHQEVVEALTFLMYTKGCMVEYLEGPALDDRSRFQPVTAISHDIPLEEEQKPSVPETSASYMSGDNSTDIISQIRDALHEVRKKLKEIDEHRKQRLLLKKKEYAKMKFLLRLLQREEQDSRASLANFDNKEVDVDQSDSMVLTDEERTIATQLVDNFLGSPRKVAVM